jgi:hypothetical protein
MAAIREASTVPDEQRAWMEFSKLPWFWEELLPYRTILSNQ